MMTLVSESHVDRPIDGPDAFVQTNVVGKHVLLDVAGRYWANLGPRQVPKELIPLMILNAFEGNPLPV